MRSRYAKNNGFTLIELVLVIVIIGILVGVAVQNGGQLFETAKIEQTKQEMDGLAIAIAGNPELENNGVRSDFGYVGDVGAMPPNLDALYTNPGSYATWNGPYISNRFTQVTDDYKKDAFGTNYSFSGGATITSSGSGSNIVRRVANSTGDLLYNSISGNVFDRDGTPPGSIYNDSIAIRLTIPNGSGSTTTKSSTPDQGGYFSFDSIPISNYNLTVIYQPADDTLYRLVSVLPNSAVYGQYNLDSNVWLDTGSSGGGGSSLEVLRPSGAGSSSALDDVSCSANWECVDEISPDGNSTYVKYDGNGWRTDLYATEDHTAGSGTIDSVILNIRCVENASNSRARTYLRTNGSSYDGSIINPTSSYADYSTGYANNPQTSSAWTWSEIDGLEIGVRLRRGARCTQVWVEVYFTN